ncbi:hypothetical protein EB796_014852 [Bugula neritina]|uniref:Uncharacterized protein n=1 Tax=Bugula neritina TaxID=10212 RepID=A0A7J7JN50_BUGNE|nr:hypothetical protein EB796_014852 [Bugula neritina]
MVTKCFTMEERIAISSYLPLLAPSKLLVVKQCAFPRVGEAITCIQQVQRGTSAAVTDLNLYSVKPVLFYDHTLLNLKSSLVSFEKTT